ncbi:MAG TPA: hypothetical protein VG328_17930 [Stellaceae bacterium]|jgi:hypothetical protein|nr:hypothetical protein [Stellaceae bacterium]
MAVGRLVRRHIGFLEATLALIVLVGLAAPFVRVPGEHPTRIAVRFQTADMPRPTGFTVHISSSICYVMRSLLSYQEPSGGEFVQIACDKKAEALAPQIRAERAAQDPIVPATETTPQ